MTLRPIVNVGILVGDLDAAIAFFEELGLEVEGRTTVEGDWVDRVVGLQGTRSDIAMMRTPDGHGRLELSRYQHAPAVGPDPRSEPANTRGMGRIMFNVDIDETLAAVVDHGAEIVQPRKAIVEGTDWQAIFRDPAGNAFALLEQAQS